MAQSSILFWVLFSCTRTLSVSSSFVHEHGKSWNRYNRGDVKLVGDKSMIVQQRKLQQHQNKYYSRLKLQITPKTVTTAMSSSSSRLYYEQGLFRPFAESIWDKLQKMEWFDDADIPLELTENVVPAKGPNSENKLVKMQTKAMLPKPQYSSLLRFARYALIETIDTSLSPSSLSSSSESSLTMTNHTTGIQVLNLIVIPSNTTTLPVLGVDFVSLPGNKHLVLLDAQPMTTIDKGQWDDQWKDWYQTHVQDKEQVFPWGGDIPEPVQPYVSDNSLWTRMVGEEQVISAIQSDLYTATMEFCDLYIDLLQKAQSKSLDKDIIGSNHQTEYLAYRRNNDPARPMLNSLFGTEWTEELLQQVLFPQ